MLRVFHTLDFVFPSCFNEIPFYQKGGGGYLLEKKNLTFIKWVSLIMGINMEYRL